MKYSNEQLKLAANTVRCLCADMIDKANSGHPGAPLGMADLAVSLWLNHLAVDPRNPTWANRDRLVFSGGHASALVYSLFHLSGMGGVTMDEVKTFRQVGSRCAGHPERGLIPGIEVTTGPLGQGIAMGVGMAIAERMENARDGALCDHRTWVFCGDGDLMEGISHEACSLAGCLKLGKLCLVYDSNSITIEGDTSIAMADDAKKRFESYGWKVFECDGHDFDSIDKAYKKAQKVEDRPVLVIATTHIGFGCPAKHDTPDVHGAPLGADETKGLKSALGFDPEKSFYVPQEVYDLFADRAAKCRRVANKWTREYKEWKKANPEKAAVREAAYANAIPADLSDKIPSFDPAKPVATRAACGTVMNAIAPAVPQLVGGSADLAPSNKTYMKGLGDFASGSYSGRNLHYGIRELAMTAIANGVTAHGGFRCFGATFFVFADYCKPALRLAALMNVPSILVFSHDSFYVGEDGPTHEPIEQMASLRCTPNVVTIRPADAEETAGAWIAALKRKDGPTCILTSRQNLPILEGGKRALVEKGAYVVFQQGDVSERTVGFVASGSEVALAVDAAKKLASEGIAVRVISMPSWELFVKQGDDYMSEILPRIVKKRVIVEAGSRFGWARWSVNESTTRYVTIDGFGASGPCKELAVKFGFTVENVYAAARSLV